MGSNLHLFWGCWRSDCGGIKQTALVWYHGPPPAELPVPSCA